MFIDLGLFIYMCLMVYAVCGVFFVIMLSLAMWALTRNFKRLHKRYVSPRDVRQMLASQCRPHPQVQTR